MSVNAPIELCALQRRRTRDEYHRMGHRRAHPIRRLTALLATEFAGRTELLLQLYIVAADESAPEPDLAVMRSGQGRDAVHPCPGFPDVTVTLDAALPPSR